MDDAHRARAGRCPHDDQPLPLGAAALGLTFSIRGWARCTGVFLLMIYGAGFAVGEISELFQHNVGITPGRWDVVLAGSVVGAAIGLACLLLGAAALVARRRTARAARASAPA